MVEIWWSRTMSGGERWKSGVVKEKRLRTGDNVKDRRGGGES